MPRPRHIDVEREIRVRERISEMRREEIENQGAESGHAGGEEGVVVQVALAEAEERVGADEAAEFKGGVERGDGFAEDEVVWDLGRGVGVGLLLLLLLLVVVMTDG